MLINPPLLKQSMDSGICDMRWCENKVVNSRRKALNQGGLRAGSSHLMVVLEVHTPHQHRSVY